MNEPVHPPGATPPSRSPASVKVAMGCMLLFTLPFLTGGAATLLAAWRELQRGASTSSVVVLFTVGGVFCAASGTIIFFAIYAFRNRRQQDNARESNPDRPWLWRADWREGVVREEGANPGLFLWPFAVLWNAISLPVLFVISAELARQNRIILVSLIFPVVGVCLIAAAIYTTARRAKYGTTTATIDRMPVPLGTTMRGELQTRVRQRPEAGFRISLASIRIETTGSGKSRTTREYELWEAKRVVSAAEVAPTPDGIRVPFTFDIPPDGESTDERDVNNRVIWRLEVVAEVPGIDYVARLQLPVFHTGDDAELAEKVATYRVAHREEYARRELPSDSQVTIEPMGSGAVEFHIRPRRDFGAIASSGIFLIIWLGAIYTMIKVGAPIVFPIFFGLFAILIIFGMIDSFFGRTVVTADRHTLVIRRFWFGRGSTKNIDPAEIDSIAVKPVGSTSRAVYDVEIRLRNATVPRALGCYLKEKDDAEIVAARMWQAVVRE